MAIRRRLSLLVLLVPAAALADRPPGVCVNVALDFTPTDNLQIVGWLEKPDGTYVDTLYITQKVGRYGMGNRPGRPDLNTNAPTADGYPYGRREQAFPIWAHKHGRTFPKVVFQNGDEDDVSHPFDDSSPELAYVRPIQPSAPNDQDKCVFDTGTCASSIFTDKGTFDPTGQTSLYPPRSDLQRKVGTDSPAVDMFRSLNPFDAVSRPTPIGGVSTTASWAAPLSVDYGSYVLFVEASKTYDFNSTYNETTFPSPEIAFSGWGKAWRGQPSVVYQVPISLAETPTRALTDTYVGYGDPLGASGVMNPPDATITTDTPGSGASRFQLVSDSGEMYRLRVRASTEVDAVPPGEVGAVELTNVASTTAQLSFMASGDDGMTGAVGGYEVRVRAGSPMTAENFADSSPMAATFTVAQPGTMQTIDLTGLLPETDYYVGIRPYDNCFNSGPLTVTKLTTLERQVNEVSWCFVATAAYGSVMANDVSMLRRFRDSVLTRTAMGELAVETYYTFGPAVAGVIGESDLLRASARAFLLPIVAAVGRFTY